MTDTQYAITQYTMGYKPIKRKRVAGISVLSKIKYSKLRVVGGGGSGIVITDGKYAIKIGDIRQSDFDKLNAAAEVGWAVPVLYFERGAEIDPRIITFLKSQVDLKNTWHRNGAMYLNKDNTADIMVMLVAQPFVSTELQGKVKGEELFALRAIAASVADAYNEATGKQWGDDHVWNIGIYRGGLIILDF
jgi:hypothetical protein